MILANTNDKLLMFKLKYIYRWNCPLEGFYFFFFVSLIAIG